MTTEAVRRALQASGVRPLRVSDVTLLGSGYANDAYRVPSEDGGGDWCLRVPRPGSPWAAEDLAREVRLLGLLARYDLGTTIPSEARTIRDGRAFLGTLHRLVEGTPLREASTRRTPTLARAVATFLSRLHAVPVEAARRVGVRDVDLWADRYAALIEETLPQLGSATQTWLRNLGRDFGDARIADPALDFAGILNDCSPAFLDAVLTHYEGAQDRDLRRRIEFYITVAPVFQVVYGDAAKGPEERLRGIRTLTARAAAASRRGASTIR